MIGYDPDDVSTRIVDTKADQDALSALAAFARSTPFIHYKQSPEWFRVCDKASHFLIVSFYNGQIVCSSIIRKRDFPILKRAKYFIDRGPLFSEPTYFNVHLSHVLTLLEPTMLSLNVNPYYGGDNRELVMKSLATMGFICSPIGDYYQRTLEVFLEKTVEELYAGFSTKLRRYIKKSESMGLQCIELMDKDQRQLFYEHYELFLNKNPDSGVLPCEEINALYDRPGSNFSCLMMIAKYEAEVVGGVLVFIAGERAIYEFGFRTLYAMKHGLPGLHLPLWHAIKRCRKMGVKYFDMGGYDPDNPEYKSISRFKSYFGGGDMMVSGRYQYVPNVFVAKLVDIAARVKYS